MRRRRMMRKSAGNNAGHFLLYDKTAKKLVTASDISALDASRFVPVGIVVVPYAHDVYGTGECGVAALRHASCSNPDSGDRTGAFVYYGQSGASISGMPDLSVAPSLGYGDTISGSPTGTTEYPVLAVSAKNDYAAIICPQDSKRGYKRAGTKIYGYAPSPFLEDGPRNPDYFRNDSPYASNILQDFDGKGNTQKLCSAATAQSDWKTAAAISTKYNAGYSPAACACWRYCPSGTKAGEWYLPAMGEVGYLCACNFEWAEAVDEIKSHLSTDIFSAVPTMMMTSTRKSNSQYWYAFLGTGGSNSHQASCNSANSTSLVIPFMRGIFDRIN